MPFPFFSRRPTPPTAAAAPAPAYDPELVPTLRGEHAVLLSLLQQVRQAAKEARYVDVSAALQRFELAYQAHQQRKERQLLPYVEHHVQMEQGKTLLRSLSGSSTLTDRSVQGFLRHYETSPVSEQNLRRFGRELDGVIAELSKRLETEADALHGLYRPARQY